VDAAEAPETVKTEGWQATQGAWQALVPQSTGSLGLLQALRNIRARATHT
jgi:hypothetical protein